MLMYSKYSCSTECFRHTMYRDAPMAKFTKNDGMINLQHCQEWSFCDFLLINSTNTHFFHNYINYFFYTIKTSWKVSMCVAAKMCCIHIWTISRFSTQLCPSFKYGQRLNSHAQKTDWSEKTRLHPFTTWNQFMLRAKSSETMQAGAKMPTCWLQKECFKWFTLE